MSESENLNLLVEMFSSYLWNKACLSIFPFTKSGMMASLVSFRRVHYIFIGSLDQSKKRVEAFTSRLEVRFILICLRLFRFRAFWVVLRVFTLFRCHREVLVKCGGLLPRVRCFPTLPIKVRRGC